VLHPTGRVGVTGGPTRTTQLVGVVTQLDVSGLGLGLELRLLLLE
jgi:hypothetical protein